MSKVAGGEELTNLPSADEVWADRCNRANLMQDTVQGKTVKKGRNAGRYPLAAEGTPPKQSKKNKVATQPATQFSPLNGFTAAQWLAIRSARYLEIYVGNVEVANER